MNSEVTAQELKTKGASVFAKKLNKNNEVFITVRGEKRFVVLSVDQYNYLKECELEAALRESENDLKQKKFKVMSLEDHLKDLKNV